MNFFSIPIHRNDRICASIFLNQFWGISKFAGYHYLLMILAIKGGYVQEEIHFRVEEVKG